MKMLCASTASVSVNAEKRRCDVYARVLQASPGFEFPLHVYARRLSSVRMCSFAKLGRRRDPYRAAAADIGALDPISFFRTRKWDEVLPALKNMVEAAKRMRESV